MPAAARRASNPAGASLASSTRTLGGSAAFSAACTAAGASADAVVSETVWRNACTPASVRLAPITRGSAPRKRRAASRTAPWTVGASGCTCQPWKSVPS